MDKAEVRDLYKTAGDFAGWYQALVLAVGNPFLQFAGAFGLVSPLLYPLKLTNGGFLFVGEGGIGKSTALMLAQSAWGNPYPLPTFKATANSVDNVGEAHNDCCLVLDEAGLADGNELDVCIYTLGNGRGKSKLNSRSELLDQKTFRLFYLGSGEVTVASKLKEAGKDLKGGIEARMASILVPNEHVVELHGCDCSKTLIDKIQMQVNNNYGHAARAFLTRLVNEKNIAKIKEEYPNFKDELSKKLCPENAGHQIPRVLDKFVVVGYAGKLAAEFGILPKSYANPDYLSVVVDGWLNCRGGTQNTNDNAILNQIKDLLTNHSAAHFQDLRSERRIDNADLWGYIGYKTSYVKPTDFIILPSAFEEVLCKDFSPKQVRNVLKENNMIRLDDRGNLPKVSVGEYSNSRLVAIHLPGMGSKTEK